MDPGVRPEDLVVANQAREDRKSGGVGAGPAGRPQGVGVEVEDRAAARGRVLPVAPDGEELVEDARPLVDHDRVPVRAALDLHVPTERVRDRIALLIVVEVDRDLRMR